MSCNCKKTAQKIEKYSDEKTLIKLKGLDKIMYIMRGIITILLIVLLFIIVVPFVIMYMIYYMIRGKKIKINVSKITKIFHVKH
jgi:hypothetical protein